MDLKTFLWKQPSGWEWNPRHFSQYDCCSPLYLHAPPRMRTLQLFGLSFIVLQINNQCYHLCWFWLLFTHQLIPQKPNANSRLQSCGSQPQCKFFNTLLATSSFYKEMLSTECQKCKRKEIWIIKAFMNLSVQFGNSFGTKVRLKFGLPNNINWCMHVYFLTSYHKSSS